MMEMILKIIRYIGYLLRWCLYKPLFRKAGIFYITSGCEIKGFANIQLGNHFFANRDLRLEVVGLGNLIIGSNVNIGRNVHIGVIERVEIGDNVLIGSNVLIIDHSHGSYDGELQDSPESKPVYRRLSKKGGVKIGKNVWIGDGVVILGGVEIGDGCVVGANSVITKSFLSPVIIVGSPAVAIREFDSKKGIWVRLKDREKNA